MNAEFNYCANKSWLLDLEHVLHRGHRSYPRGMGTLEVLGHRSPGTCMSWPVLTVPGRAIGHKFMAAEAAWILSGRDDVASIAPYSKEIAKFSDDGVRFAGAYGPKVVDQMQYVVAALHRDQDTRQAVINIWREKPGPSKDVPCTLSAQFLIRNGLLYCVDTMRSSDLWLGHPYDVFNFSMLSLYVALRLRAFGVSVGLGNLYMTAGSKHLYDKNVESAKRVFNDDASFTVGKGPELDVDMFGTAQELIDWLWDRAAAGDLATWRE